MADKANYTMTDPEQAAAYYREVATEIDCELDGQDDDVLEALGRSVPWCICGRDHVRPGAIAMCRIDRRGKMWYKFAAPQCADRAATWGSEWSALDDDGYEY
mgnify:CR=1 FL=1